MGLYILRRTIYMVFTLFAVSFVAFFIIQLPPGDYVSTYALNLASSGTALDAAELESLRRQFGLDQPMIVRYMMWLGNLLQGDLGYSFEWQRPVSDLLGQRLMLTVIISVLTLILTYAIAIPIGIYSATRQYSVGDHVATALGLVGLATPSFLLALVLMVVFSRWFGYAPTGLFSTEYANAPWSLEKVGNLMIHLPIPIIVISTAGTASLTRIMRATLLDELKKPYVIAARARGLHERKLLFRYPVRIAINPIASTIGWVLPTIISGSTIVEIVLDLPTIGPLLLRSLLSQDTYLAASLLVILSFLTIIGTFISDLVLLWLDPRIRFERTS